MAHSDVTLFHNAKITTLDDAQPDADTLAVANGRIVFVGKEADAADYFKGAGKVIDLKQHRVLPGFVESHGHFLGTGFAKMNLDLRGTTSQDQIAERISLLLNPPASWIKGRGWDQNHWPTKEFPTHAALTKAAPSNPVVLTRIDGHALWCNEKALTLAGITKETKDPSGGLIIRDADGNPTGVFVDTAMDLILSKVPKPSDSDALAAAKFAQREALSLGITSFHDAGVGDQTIRIFEKLGESKQLQPRIYAMLDGDDAALLDRYFAKGPQINLYDRHLSIRSIKLYSDGALGSRGAALLEPYSDDPKNLGLIIADQDRVASLSRTALARGFQIATHAIGDRANRFVLDAYESADPKATALPAARFRVEHAQIVNPADVARFSKLGIIASMQPTHCSSDAPWVPARLGDERSKSSAYVWRDFMNAKVPLAFGSDTPIEALNPMLGLYASMVRSFYPEQALTLVEALKAFTVGGAYAEFSENEKGRLKVGYLADFIVVNKDIMNLPASELLSARVLRTVIGGETVYEGPENGTGN